MDGGLTVGSYVSQDGCSKKDKWFDVKVELTPRYFGSSLIFQSGKEKWSSN